MAVKTQAKIKEIIPRTYNVKSFRLELDEWTNYKAGQYLFIKLLESKQPEKPLTISSSPTEKDYIEFTKKITSSEFSKELNNLKVGDEVGINYPFGNFTLTGRTKKIAFLSGGVGITPIRSICKFALDKTLDIDIALLYANRTPEDIVFREDFDKWQKECKGLKVVHVLSRVRNAQNARSGHIDNQIVKEEISDYKERKFYICGPPLMVSAMRNALSDELKIKEKDIIIENFAGY